ncbi:Presequence protease, mitochondrial [Desmophyllum pertusum]|uniref:Presequence protease, mitochondrial n=1 Tax=Desmophyllum pertusum TaxID=174260 RepID=A0A9W9ZQ26_9CNID|nr:Presequence protease, mitochondrial [Desmophyllum pertusum]
MRGEINIFDGHTVKLSCGCKDLKVWRMWRANRCLFSPPWNHLSRHFKWTTLKRGLCVLKEKKKYNSLEAASQLKSGDKIHGYTVNKVVSVPELFLVSVQLTHDKTGAEHLHIARDDSNNVFSVGFRTTPMDSTGVSHILEAHCSVRLTEVSS